MSGIPCERCPSCDKMKYSASKNPDGLCDECRGNPASKPPAPTVGETPTTDDIMLRVDGPMHHQEYVHGAVSQLEYGLNECRRKLLNTERDLTAAQLEIERLKARKIDVFALAKELGPKISLNLNEWEVIAKAVEAQLEKRK